MGLGMIVSPNFPMGGMKMEVSTIFVFKVSFLFISEDFCAHAGDYDDFSVGSDNALSFSEEEHSGTGIQSKREFNGHFLGDALFESF